MTAVPIPPPEFDPSNPEEPVKGSFRIRNILSSVNRTVLAAGTTVGKYKIIDEIDRGGMAVVYKATQLDLKRTVALKVMPANVALNHRFVERFLGEAQSIAKLNHTNIVNIYEIATENNIYYIAMEYIAGKNLYQYLNESKPKLVDVLEIVAKLAEALSYAHAQKIIHRDLKLNNVIMRDPLTPVLIDFGLAKALEDSDSGGGITRTGEIMGSPAYMAPERLQGEDVDHRSDICSLGIMLYEMLTFKNPYLDQRNLHQTTYNVMEATPIPPKKLVPWLPAEIEAITLKAMAKDPAMRYQTMDEFRADIMRYRQGDTVLAKPPSLKKRTTRFMRKKWAPIAITGLVLLFSAILAIGYFVQKKKVYSHWQLVYTLPTNLAADEWALTDRDSLLPGKWEDGNRSIRIASQGFTHIRLERRFNRDVLIEFNLRSPARNIYRAGLFLFGESPDDAHCVHINRDGFGASGITFPGSDFLFQDAEPGTIPWLETNKIVVERLQNSITLTINGVQTARVHDFFPPVGKDHEKVGFFVDGTDAVFSNVKVYRRAIPQTPSPTLIADRFRERGDFETAIEEYNGLMIDQSALNLAKDIHINIAECQIRLGRYSEALSTLEKSAQLHSSDAHKARSRYLMGMANRFMDNHTKAANAFSVVAKNHKASPVNFSVAADIMINCANKISEGDFDGADADITAGIISYPQFISHWGALHIRILEWHARSGEVEQATSLLQQMTTLYSGYTDIITHARLVAADAYLNAGQTTGASAIYNQSIHTQHTSDHIWRAWYALGELYEYDFDYKHAATLYAKVWKESSPNSMIYWMAALKCAELSIAEANGIEKSPLLHEVVNGVHPYPVPRIIASYYLSQITEIEFLSLWDNLYPQDSWSLYYVARKLLLQGNKEEAVSVIKVLQRQLPEKSWRSFQVLKILYNSERWQ